MVKEARTYFKHVMTVGPHGPKKVCRGTVCVVMMDDGEMLVGVSICRLGDNFNKKIGRDISSGRAWMMRGAEGRWRKRAARLEIKRLGYMFTKNWKSVMAMPQNRDHGNLDVQAMMNWSFMQRQAAEFMVEIEKKYVSMKAAV